MKSNSSVNKRHEGGHHGKIYSRMTRQSPDYDNPFIDGVSHMLGPFVSDERDDLYA